MFRIFDYINQHRTYVIAEMSANHGGSLDNAIRIVHEAKRAGADCLKIQTYTADTITINCKKEAFKCGEGLWENEYLYDLYQKAYTPWEWQPIIKKECEKVGIDFLSTPFDPTAVDFLESIDIAAYKIASFELVDLPLIEYTASKQKPMILSTGMASFDEIQDAVTVCKKAGNEQIVLLKCCSEYPSKWEDMHLADISEMRTKLDLPVGISDHSIGFLADVIAVSMGACVIEKHIKLSDVVSEDTGFSMSVEEFAEMVKNVRNTETIIGNVYFGPTSTEDYGVRRSLYAVKDIREGETFSESNVRSIRPAGGLLPKYYYQLLGRTSKRNIAFGDPILESDLN